MKRTAWLGLGLGMAVAIARPGFAALPSLEDANRIVAQRPNDSRAYLLRGGLRYEAGDRAGGLADMDRAIGLNPQYVDAFLMRCEMKYKAGDMKGALADVERALSLAPQSAKGYAARGLITSEMGDNAAAIADFNRALALDPNNAMAYNGRGVARNLTGDNDGSREDFARASALGLKTAGATNLGNAKAQVLDYAGAISDYDRALAIDPQSVPTLISRGMAKAVTKDHAGALADFDRAVQLDPRNSQAVCNRGYMRLKLGDFDGALADFDRASQLDPRSEQMVKLRGIARCRIGQYKEAIPDFERALRNAPDNWESLAGLAEAKASTGELRAALECCDAAARHRTLGIANVDTFLADLRGGIFKEMGDYAASAREYERASAVPVTMVPGSAGERERDWADRRRNSEIMKEVHVLLCDGDYAAVQRWLNVVRYSEAGPYQAIEYRGIAQLQSGDLRSAVEGFTTLIKLNPRSAQAYYHRALARDADGDLRGARDDYVRALGLRKSPVPDIPSDAREIPPILDHSLPGQQPAAEFRRELFTYLGEPDEERRLRIHAAVTMARLGQAESLETLRTLAAGWPTGLSRTVASYLAGAVPEKTVVDVATSSSAGKDRGDAFYYLGVKHLLDHDDAGAKDFFSKSAAIGLTTSGEHALARAESRRSPQ